MSKYEVTQGEWKKVMGTEPWSGQESAKGNASYAVSYVSWEDCQEMVKKLSTGVVKFSLPTEAEWEYACRAGTVTGLSFGDDDSNLGDYAWCDKNTLYISIEEYYSHAVGQKKPNPWGLYDMHGNVWEWCQDWYGDYPTGSVTDPTGPTGPTDVWGRVRVLRGGGWRLDPSYCRSACRGVGEPDLRNDYVGCRLALRCSP
ncbi:MAG: formylglycine-generating enzyme family protein [Planctomycetes bacterium]|nr:formylglycine-generating enzyme family protein [Planctomycetota bacterium]